MRLFIFAAISLAALPATLAGPATAQEAPLQQVYACADKSDAAERLSCYDAAVAGLRKAETTGDVAVVSREQIAEADKQAFGLRQAPATAATVARSNASPAAPPIAALPDSVKATITAVAKRADGRFRFTLDNGQVWEQSESDKIREPRTPVSAEIRKAMMGSFMMSIEGGGRGIRVRRVS